MKTQAGSLALIAVLLASATASAQSEFKAPVRLEAAGEIIDTVDSIGHNGPILADIDEDGSLDLLVGVFSGNLQLYRNTGDNVQPVYAAKELLQAAGEDIRIHNW